MEYQILLPFYRVLVSRPLNRLTLFFIDEGIRRFGSLLPRDLLEGIDQFFVRDLIGNIDLDGDGFPDSFRMAITNAWFDQRLLGLELTCDGTKIPKKEILLKMKEGEISASEIKELDFPPGEVIEVILPDRVLSDGLHLMQMMLEMDLCIQMIPIVPLIVKNGVGDIAVSPDRFKPLPEWPPDMLECGEVHVVPHIHYDVEWLKTRDVFEKVGEGNLKEALRLLADDSEMTFVIDQVPHLEPFRRGNPEDFEKLLALVRDGRIEPVDGMYSEPDVNLISGESLVRQSVYWQEYARNNFGFFSSCGWLIDSFGMSAQLPQIFSKSGVRFFIFSRAMPPEGTPSEFFWEGIDGTRILAHNMPAKYNIGHPMPTDRDRALRVMLKNYLFLRRKSASEQIFYPCGVDHGRPQKEYGEMSAAWNSEVDSVKFSFSLPSKFFESLPEERLPVVRGEFQRELWGTYSARMSLKILNRACEFALMDAEKLASITSTREVDGHFEYPCEVIEEGWRKIMDNQFHDQICGCSTDEVAEGMRKRFKDALEIADGVMSGCASILTGSEGSKGEDDNLFTLFVFNPLSFELRTWVEFDIYPRPGWNSFSIIDPEDGSEIPHQVVDIARYGDGTMKRAKVGICPELPPLGYRFFIVRKAERDADFPDEVSVDGATLSNAHLTLMLDPEKGLLRRASVRNRGASEDKSCGESILFDLRGGNCLTLERDFGDLYNVFALGTTWLHRRKVEEVRAIEAGPLRAMIRVKGKIGRTPFAQRVSLHAGSPRLDIETELDYKDRYKRLRVKFPTEFGGGIWTHEIPYGVIQRPGHELPAQNFVDLSSVDGKKGITLINFGIPPNKVDKKGTIYLTLLRSTDKIYSFDSGPGALELGKHKFMYSLYPHFGDWRSGASVRQAYIHNNKPRAFVFKGKPFCSTYSFSALSCDPLNVLVSVLSRDEEGSYIIRLWETQGEKTSVNLKPGWDFSSAAKIDFLGREMEKLSTGEGAIKFSLGPFEIGTLRIS